MSQFTLYWPSSSLKAVTAAAILTPATTVPPSFCPSPKVFVPSCVLFPFSWIGSSFPGLFGGLRIFEAHIMYCERLHPFQTTVTITKIYSFFGILIVGCNAEIQWFDQNCIFFCILNDGKRPCLEYSVASPILQRLVVRSLVTTAWIAKHSPKSPTLNCFLIFNFPECFAASKSFYINSQTKYNVNLSE